MKIVINETQLSEIIKNIKELNAINEGITDIVYHFTNLMSLSEILKKNKFETSPSFGSTSDLNLNKKYPYFFSTTRNKKTGFTSGNVKIKLNGRKLGQNYKSIPLEYWSGKEINRRHIKPEHEDRILTNSDEIPDALKYIMEIHIEQKSINEKILNNILNITKENTIPIYFYDNRNDFLNENIKNSIKPIPISNEEEYVHNEILSHNFFLAALAAYKNENNHRKIVIYLKDEEIINRFNNFLNNDFIEDFENSGAWGWKYDDMMNKIKSVVHSSRTLNYPFTRFIVKLIADEMRKIKVKNLGDYVKEKYWIGKKKQEYFNKIIFDNVSKRIDLALKEEIDYQNEKRIYIEIDGEYFNNFIEAPEILNILHESVSILKYYLKNNIIANNDKFRINYKLDKSYIREHILESGVFNKFDEINVTDGWNEKSSYKEDIKDIILYGVISKMDLMEEIEKQMEKYKSQFDY